MILKIYQFILNRSKRKFRYFRNYCKLVSQICCKGGYIGTYTTLKHCEYVKLGTNVKINEQVRIECYPEYLGVRHNPELVIEDGTIIGPNFTAFVADSVTIKRNCIFAGCVTLVSENHGTNPLNSDCYKKEPLQTGPIVVGEGCWLGQNVTVLPNTTIGDRCIVASNAVVRGEVPSFSMVAGIPAKVIKMFNCNTNCWERV